MMTSDAFQPDQADQEGRGGERSPTNGAEIANQRGEADAQMMDPTAELRAKVQSLEDALLRSKADFQNLQRRSAVERSEAIRFANAELMKALLNVLDDFDRSLTAADGAKSEDLASGVRLVHENLLKALGDYGLETIEAKGQRFDPTVHEALLHQPAADAAPQTVIEQIARGYRLRDRVLRPARVVVAKAVDEAKGIPQSDSET